MFLLFGHVVEELRNLREMNAGSLQVTISNGGLIGKVLVIETRLN
jgi:hypothetical protein